MSHFDGYSGEMRRFSDISDQELERLLTGKAPADKQLEDLAEFLGEVRSASVVPPSHAVEQRHLANIVATSQLFVEKGEPGGRPASKAIGPEPQVSGLPKRRRRFVFSSLLTSLLAKILAASVALAAVGGAGAAATGNLDDVKTLLTQAAQNVGIEIPEGEEVSAGADAKIKVDGDDVDADLDAEVDGDVELSDKEEGEEEEGEEGGAASHSGGGMSAFVHEVKETTPPGERGRVICAEASNNQCTHDSGTEEGDGPGNSGNTPAAEHRNNDHEHGNGHGVGGGDEGDTSDDLDDGSVATP